MGLGVKWPFVAGFLGQVGPTTQGVKSQATPTAEAVKSQAAPAAQAVKSKAQDIAPDKLEPITQGLQSPTPPSQVAESAQSAGEQLQSQVKNTSDLIPSPDNVSYLLQITFGCLRLLSHKLSCTSCSVCLLHALQCRNDIKLVIF